MQTGLAETPHKTGFLGRLQQRWKLKSITQVLLVLLVFACTGFTVLFIKRPLFNWLGIYEQKGVLRYIVYLIAVLPLYQVLLLAYGFIFGQFRFFWEFEKRMFRRIFRIKTKK